MRIFVLSALAITAAVVFATGTVAPNPDDEPEQIVAEDQPAGVMPSGALFGPLTPVEPEHGPVAVPEPVWASVLAACAVSLLRRGRAY